MKEVEPQAPASEYLDATVYSKDSTDKTTADGSIEGSVSFKGAAALLVFAYDANGDEAARVTLSPADDGGERTAKFSLENLPAGEYTLHFRFKGDAAAGIDVRGKKVVTIRSATLDPITLTVSENNGKITATISGAMERDIDVWINEVSEDGEKRVSGTIIWGNGTAELGTFANGSYKVYADYASPTFDANGNSTTRKHSDTITVTGGGSTTVTPERPSVTEITGNVSKTKDSITVSLHADNDFKVVIAIEGKNTGYSSMVEIAPGAALTHIFTGLAEDTYEIYADYYD